MPRRLTRARVLPVHDAARPRLPITAAAAAAYIAAAIVCCPVASSAQAPNLAPPSSDASARPPAARAVTGGVYTDRTGKAHTWTVSATHSLMWDGQAYIPVGGQFAPRYFAEGQTEENWKRDTDGLALLKSKGLLDVIVNPTIPATDVPAAAWQRLVDYLDANGFRYGISFGAGLTAPLTGTVVKPAKYRVDGVPENGSATWQLADTDRARYFFVDPNDGTQVMMEGDGRVLDGALSVQANARVTTGVVAIVYPHKTLRAPVAAGQGGLPDLWNGFDAYRDRVLAIFSQVKFGPGLRFFLDPLGHALNPTAGEVEDIVPDSPGFRLEWEAFLRQKHVVLDDLMNVWHIQEREIKDYAQAARLIPLAADERGLPYMLDPQTGHRYETRGGSAGFWSNLKEFRESSISYYLNTAADVLKREVADVPVVYTRSRQDPVFTNKQRAGGFDGLGMDAYGRGSALITSGADSVVSQSDASSRPLWCLVTETLDTASPAKDSLGYASEQAMAYDLDWLRSVGAKGFFVNGFQVLPDTSYKNFQLLRSPEQIAWVKNYADKLGRGLGLETVRTARLLYPREAAGYIHSGPIGSTNVWWAPSLASGQALRFGTSYAGYTIDLPEGKQTVLWSLRGPRKTHLLVGDPRQAQITTPDGVPVPNTKLDLKHKSVELTLDLTPVVIRGNETDVFPTEATEDELLLLKTLVNQADTLKLPAAFEYRLQFERAFSNYRLHDSRIAFAVAAQAVNGLIPFVQPYTWLEAERAVNQTFTEITNDPAASGEAYLTLNTDARPGIAGYGAEYSFSVPTDESYTLWIACTPPGPNASPFVWIVDEDQKGASADGAVVGESYLGNHFVWMNLGRVFLKKGSHALLVRVTDPAPGLGRYSLSADAILVTRGAFIPNGTTQPSLLGPLEDNAAAMKQLNKDPYRAVNPSTGDSDRPTPPPADKSKAGKRK